MKTQEQIEADKLLDEAVQATVVSYKLLPEDHLIVDFVVAIEGQGMIPDEDDAFPEAFGIAYKNGTMRSIIATGILYNALFLLTNGERVEGES